MLGEDREANAQAFVPLNPIDYHMPLNNYWPIFRERERERVIRIHYLRACKVDQAFSEQTIVVGTTECIDNAAWH